MSLMQVDLKMMLSIPHDLYSLAGAEVAGDLLQAAQDGRLPMEVRIEMKVDAPMEMVEPAVLEMWRSKLADNESALLAARTAWKSFGEIDDDNTLGDWFMAWPPGTNAAEVDGWFEMASRLYEEEEE